MPTAKAKITTVDDYIAAHRRQRPEHADALDKLRGAVHIKPLEETIKWGAPCYVHKGKNIVGLAAFKAYVGLWFHQGALLTDPENALITAGDGSTKAQRQWRFQTAADIPVRKVRAYVREAIALVDDGKEIKPDRDKPLIIPPELNAALKADPQLSKAFDAMSKSCRREYAGYIAEAKRDATRQTRLAKVVPMIRSGGGLHDKYRNC